MIPNTTQIPNNLFNGEMAKMKDTELRITLLVARKTLGWIENTETGMRKEEDWISRSQLVKFTGKTGRAISTAIENCVIRGWIESRDKEGKLLDTPQKRGGQKIFYRLGKIFLDRAEQIITSEKSSQVEQTSEKIAGEKIAGEKSSLYKRKDIYTKETYKQKALTPIETMKLFLEREDYFNKVVSVISEKYKVPSNIVLEELKKFKSYWSELNGSGKKQRWELQKTFELQRRIATWFKNVEQFSNKKGKTIIA